MAVGHHIAVAATAEEVVKMDVDIHVQAGVLEDVMALVNGDAKPHAGVVVQAVL